MPAWYKCPHFCELAQRIGKSGGANVMKCDDCKKEISLTEYRKQQGLCLVCLKAHKIGV